MSSHSNYIHCLIYGDQFKDSRLEEFRRQSRRLNLSSLKESLGNAQFNEFKKAFDMFDKDGDGSITRPELVEVVRSLTGKDASDAGIDFMIEEGDLDGDGSINMEEFLQMMVAKCIKARNHAKLDAYASGRSKGDSSVIHPTLDTKYTFEGLLDTDVVTKNNFKAFWFTFRKNVASGGGPKVESEDFMRLTNIIRKESGEAVIESGNWEVPGFARGSYLVSAQGGRILWEKDSIAT